MLFCKLARQYTLILFISLGTKSETNESTILGLRLIQIDDNSYYNKQGQLSILHGTDVEVQLIGTRLEGIRQIYLTNQSGKYGEKCNSYNISNAYLEKEGSLEGPKKVVLLNSSHLPNQKNIHYICIPLKESNTSNAKRVLIHQGIAVETSIDLRPDVDLHFPIKRVSELPGWVIGISLVILLTLSGLFSGLNLGLMTLNPTDLKIISTTGSESEKYNANVILPLRIYGHFLLCSILLGNVLVNVLIAIFFDHIPGANGPIAVVLSTIGIVVFGEVIPQAICSRHGLTIGGKTILLTKCLMLLTSPLAWPVSIFLDYVLGKEVGTVYSRKSLLELLRLTSDETDINADEINILTGTLELQDKQVADIMTPLTDCYMLSINTILDYHTIHEIRTKGYSRVPVYDGERVNIVFILIVKDLLFVDPDDEKSLREVFRGHYKNPFMQVSIDKPLHEMLNEFRTGNGGHMAIIKDYGTVKSVGIITLKDIIEELMQSDIIDEDDIDPNKSKKKRIKTKRLMKKEIRMAFGDVSI